MVITLTSTRTKFCSWGILHLYIDMANFQHLSIQQLKEQLSIDVLQIIRSPKTQKLFGAGSNGVNLRCQQAIDVDKPISFFYDTEVGGVEDGCIVNSAEDSVIKTL